MSTPLDFDFLIGSWSVSHRRLKHRLAGANEWDEFRGTLLCSKILGGMGNSDQNYLELPGEPYHAMTVRAFDPKSEEWSIWWFDGRYPGFLDPPVKGQFVDSVGTFFAKDNYQGTPDPGALLVGCPKREITALGASFLPRRGKDLGNELDYDFQQGQLIAAPPDSRCG